MPSQLSVPPRLFLSVKYRTLSILPAQFFAPSRLCICIPFASLWFKRVSCGALPAHKFIVLRAGEGRIHVPPRSQYAARGPHQPKMELTKSHNIVHSRSTISISHGSSRFDTVAADIAPRDRRRKNARALGLLLERTSFPAGISSWLWLWG